jgi:REP element-mobilizing transposase RayT
MHGTKPDAKRTGKEIPLAYFITFRSYGTWLHGRRGSVDRFHNTYGTPRLPPDKKRLQYNLRRLSQRPATLGVRARAAVDSAIRETCEIRNWGLWAFNIRTNHVHSVVSANCQPGLILNALKANATRKMRETGCWRSERSPWVRRGSKRYLWNERALLEAIAYVLYDQGEPLP